jgi:hypothetical protein
VSEHAAPVVLDAAEHRQLVGLIAAAANARRRARELAQRWREADADASVVAEAADRLLRSNGLDPSRSYAWRAEGERVEWVPSDPAPGASP